MASCKYTRLSSLSMESDWYAFVSHTLLYAHNILANEHHEEDAMEDDDSEVWVGNRHRKLWKSTCTRAALNVRVPLYLILLG
jgi:hypothetical protein